MLHFRVLLPGNATIATSGCCHLEIEVSFFLSCTIAGYCYSEDDQFPSIDTRKLFNFRVLLLRNCPFPGNNTRKFDNFQLPGNNNRKLTRRQKCWVNFRVTIPGHFQFPSIVTRKLRNFWVTIPGKLFNFWVLLPGSQIWLENFNF